VRFVSGWVIVGFFLTDETIRRIREGESRSLANALGIPVENLHFLSFPSNRIAGYFSEIIKSLSNLFRELAPQEVYTVAYEHSEFEHDGVNAAVNLAVRQSGATLRLYEFPVFNRHKGKLRFHKLIPYDGIPIQHTPFSKEEERERVRLFIEHFPSQWFGARLDQGLSLLPSEYKKLGEPYRQMPEHDYSNPLQETEIMYQPKSLDFQFFRKTVIDLME
jgi:LmbE family N-acetylglucosaminyl deacetylase